VANLRIRATELRSLGLTKHQAFRLLKHEFPHAERDQLVSATNLSGAPTGYHPIWVQVCGFGILNQVTIKNDPRKFS